MPVIVLGVLYLLIGIAFGALAGSSEHDRTRTMWRLAAWLVSAVLFAAHIWYEHFRIRNPPRSIALHASSAAALGAFALAIAANVHARATGTGNLLLLAIAVLVWPLITWLPAFVVARVAVAVLARIRRSA